MVDINLNFNDFNAESFGIGLAAGWLTAYGVYRARHVLGAARTSLSQQATSAQNFATRSADSLYIEDLLRSCESNHLAGKTTKLSNLLVEPRFLPAPALASPPDDGELPSVFRVVPIVPDYPYLHAPYNVETLSIEDLGNGDRAIALLGLPGSGRTTALQAIALWSLGKLNFTAPIDKVQQQLDAEEKQLSNEERSKRVKERLAVQEMALQSLAKGKGTEANPDPAERRKVPVPVFKRLTPVYTHLANISFTPNEFGRHIDPAEPLIRAVQHHVTSTTAKNIPRKLYERLAEGKVLLLLDGYNDLPESEQRQKLAWLQAFMAEYSSNFVIIVGSATGYGGLTRAGFTPVFLRPWNDIQADGAVDGWREHWPQISGARRRAGAKPAPETIGMARLDNRGRSAFEQTLKMWSNFEDSSQFDPEGWIRGVISRYLPDNQPIGVVLPRLAQLAALQLDEGYITPERLEQVMSGKIAQPLDGSTSQTDFSESDDEVSTFLSESDDDLSAFEDDDLSEFEADPKPAAPQKAAKSNAVAKPKPAKAAAQPKTNAARDQAKLLAALRKSGLLITFKGGRYQFRHALFAAYLASLYLKELGTEQVLDKSNQPAWRNAFVYAALHIPLDAVVKARLAAPADVLQANVLEMARWLAYAPPKVEWRPALLKQLGNMFVASNQYPLLRERTAAALVGTRDHSVIVAFKRGLQHLDNDVRRLSCLGLGALRDESAVMDLGNLLQDKSTEVQLAAGLALGAIATPEALEEMVVALTDGSEQLRQAIAEAFAAIPDEGYPILYDAVNHEEMMLRRAAVFGLRRVNTPWSLVSLYRTALEDDQWYVRSAAEQAFYDLQYGDAATGVHAYPAVESIPWLREWVALQGEDTIKEIQQPDEILLMALEERDPLVQRLAVANIGQLGLAAHINTIYTILGHQSPDVRDAAYRALGDLQSQIGQPLPSPN